MKTTAGAGFTWVDTAQVELVIQGLVFSASPDAVASFTTPSGAWTRLNSVFANCDNGLALASNTLKVTAFTALLPVYATAPAYSVAAAQARAFTLSVYGVDNENTNAQIVTGNLPDIWLQPLTLVNVQWVGGDGVGAITNGRVTYEVARNIRV